MAKYVQDNLLLLSGARIKNPIAQGTGLPLTDADFPSMEAIVYTGAGSSNMVVQNAPSPLIVKLNGVIQSPWSELVATADGQYHTVITFKNGNYIEAMYSGGENINYAFKYANGTRLGGGGEPFLRSSYISTGFSIIDNLNNTYTVGRFGGVNDGNEFIHWLQYIFTQTNFITSDCLVSAYSWAPFDTLRGDGGQYRCKLTMINEDAIGDYTTPTITSDRDDFDRISEQASLLSYFQNAPLGVPVTVAWSGDNWLTMTATKNPEPDTKDYLLNLQFRYALTDSIIYSYTARIQLEDYQHIPYLSFIVDDENEVAVFDCVTYYSASQSDPDPHWGYLGRSQTDASMHALWLWLQGSIGAPESDSPFNGGTTDNGGEGGNPIPQDDMPRPALPSLDAANLGFFTVYNFTDSDEQQLQDIADFLWSDNVLDNFKKYFNNFSDNIFALYILPYTPATLPTKNFKVGRMESEDITGVKYLVSRYVDLPMGEVRVDPRWTSYVDYAPYTRFELYLPGIGIHSIDADDIMSPADSNGVLNAEQGSLISIKYTLDLFTGIVVAFVFIDGQMRYQFSGKVGQTIPITGENYSSMVSTFISGAASLASTIASGGLTAPLAGAAVAGTIAAQKPEVYRSGNMSGDVSLMSERTPYLIRHVPNKPEIVEQEKFTGFPSYKTGKVRDFGGYLEALEIHVEELNCCEEERDKIRSLFKSGVIL